MRLSRSQQRLLRRISTRRGREAEGVVLLEGPRVIKTAIENGAEVLFAVRDETAGPLPPSIDVVEVGPEELREFTNTDTPQGTFAVARQPHSELPAASLSRRASASSPPATSRPVSGSPAECVLLLDGVQDPGNTGTLVRTAAALGLGRVLVLEGTADPWGPKAVRASAGLVFKIPVHGLRWASARDWLRAVGLPLIVADPEGRDVRSWLLEGGPRDGSLSGNAVPHDPDREQPGWALLVANEGAGPRREALSEANARLAVPHATGVDSLNVASAGAILIWALGPGRAACPSRPLDVGGTVDAEPLP